MRLHRTEGWECRLEKFFAESLQKPFAWGSWDGAIFAAAGVEALTGVDLAASWRGTYDSEAGSAALLRHLGHAGLRDLATACLGSPLTVVNRAGRGDVVFTSDSVGACLGLIDLTGQSFMAMNERKGMVRLPRKHAVAAWRV